MSNSHNIIQIFILSSLEIRLPQAEFFNDTLNLAIFLHMDLAILQIHLATHLLCYIQGKKLKPKFFILWKQN